jgi:hypothetical protein
MSSLSRYTRGQSVIEFLYVMYRFEISKPDINLKWTIYECLLNYKTPCGNFIKDEG